MGEMAKGHSAECLARVGLLTRKPKLVAIFILISTIFESLVAGRSDVSLLEEGRELRKRFAKFGEEFEGHDIAMTSHDDGRGRFRRSSNLDLASHLYGGDTKNIRLDFSSGKSLDMTLRHVPHVNAETEIVHNTHEGRVKRSTSGNDLCLASGEVGEGGLATFSFCDGLFGTVSVDGFEYLVHPVERRSVKRDIRDNDNDDGEKVHVMWRRSTPGFVDGIELHSISKRDLWDQVNISDTVKFLNSTELVIELALFSDAEFCSRLRKVYPNQRQFDAFILTKVAAVQAMFGDRRKVGYDVKFKVKVLEYWDVDPNEYDFEQSLSNNLRSFCDYTKDLYSYDLRGLNTGITEQGGPAVGMAYVSSACAKNGCFNSLVRGSNVNIYAHEIGHTLSMAHPSSSKCPTELNAIKGFMGSPPDFSPCNKWELNKFLETGKGSCFLVEDGESRTPQEYQELLSGFDGQIRTPDQNCELYSGPGFEYYPIGPRTGQNVCRRWFCLNANESDSNFGKLEQKSLPFAFPCGDKMFCGAQRKCYSLETTPGIGWDVEYMKAHEGISQWSEWSEEWTPCSRSCGTGVQLRKRVCQKSTLNIQPYCEGRDFIARLCNHQVCPEDPSEPDDLIQARADEVCSRLVANDEDFSVFLPKGIVLDNPRRLPEYPSKSCLLACERGDDEPNKLMPQAILPDGTFCKNALERPYSDVTRFGIELRCVRGRCVEFSGCPNDKEKDSCGICNGGNQRCVTVNIDSSYDIPTGERALLAVIPAGATFIEVKMNWRENKWINLELWSEDGTQIIGRGGALYPKNVYVGSDAVNYAGASWTYNRKASFLRSEGPINETVDIRAHKGSTNPIKEITVSYAAPEI